MGNKFGLDFGNTSSFVPISGFEDQNNSTFNATNDFLQGIRGFGFPVPQNQGNLVDSNEGGFDLGSTLAQSGFGNNPSNSFLSSLGGFGKSLGSLLIGDENSQGVGPFLSGAGSIFQAFNASKAAKLAEQQLQQNRLLTNRNLQNQASVVNQQLRNQYRADIINSSGTIAGGNPDVGLLSLSDFEAKNFVDGSPLSKRK